MNVWYDIAGLVCFGIAALVAETAEVTEEDNPIGKNLPRWLIGGWGLYIVIKLIYFLNKPL